MRIWLVRDLEPIPTDPGNRRLMRAGMLATTLANLGHQTCWITSSFDHYQKRQRSPRLQEIVDRENLKIKVLPGVGYRRNISLSRIWHNYAFAQAFERCANDAQEPPDVIVTDIPTTEAAAAAISFGTARGIPTVLSIRDLWPDFFADHVPGAMRPIARIALSPLERQVRFACRNATSLIGISPAYLDWGLRKGKRIAGQTDKVFPLGYSPRQAKDSATTDLFLQQLGIRPDSKVVAFIGSWGHTYDLPLVLETARKLSNRSDIQFVIGGNGTQFDSLRPKFSELPNILLPGWVNADEIAAILRRTSIGLLPYHSTAPQGWPNKAFEYLAYGAYQISTIIGELETLYSEVKGAGQALESPRADQLAAAISKALDDPEIDLGRAARLAAFKSRFDADLIYHQFAEHIIATAKGRIGSARWTVDLTPKPGR